MYTCKICEINIRQKRNVKPHLKSKRHLDNTKHRVAMRDEAITGTGDLTEVGFTRNTENPRPGCHCLILFKRPIKYKIARRLMKMACSCVLCLKAFRSSELYSRHLSSKAHKEKVKFEKAKKKLGVKEYFLRSVKLRQNWEKSFNFIRKAAVCNEFGSSRMKNSHAHMYCQTEEKYTFQKFKSIFFKKFGVRITDIRRPVNFRECVRYVTKEDKQAILLNIPLKFTSAMYRGYRYFNEVSSSGVVYGDFIPSTVAASDRKVFEAVVSYEGKLQDARHIHQRVMNLELLPWQQELLDVLNTIRDSNRAIVWVVDVPGGAGKSIMSQWLLSMGTFGKGILFQDFDYRNNSYLFNGEQLVIFDIPRHATPTDLRFIEDCKNGYMISTKNECRQKIFRSPVVVVFSNEYPEKTLLSIDRWHVYSIGIEMADGNRTGSLIHHPEFNV